ncbi:MULTISPECIES: hypothetical protein [Streptomyces]|uniref:Uncharacterized protein n=1 Tax=Streptomyces katrae TaxID=68223 RepID=A0A0F4JW57_9ACTN|nr:hypothetical protein [Streptomyces katrae]KJY37216.1 hypothetical protein VR44_06220 [Streptomyces katrae]MCF3180967.1 hypothetical protein [Streptomyces polychromogenes]
MPATTHTPSLPARAVRRRPGAYAHSGARLHWWTLALPALAFGLLLLLLAGSGQAQATADRPAGLVEVTQELLRAVG